MSLILYGIPNCDTVKKARTWLTEQGRDFVFHDFKKNGTDQAILESWLTQVSWEVLLNRKGMTWRNLPDERKAMTTDATQALKLMLENPSIIKRPVLVEAGKVKALGFSAAQYSELFA